MLTRCLKVSNDPPNSGDFPEYICISRATDYLIGALLLCASYDGLALCWGEISHSRLPSSIGRSANNIVRPGKMFYVNMYVVSRDYRIIAMIHRHLLSQPPSDRRPLHFDAPPLQYWLTISWANYARLKFILQLIWTRYATSTIHINTMQMLSASSITQESVAIRFHINF